MSYVSRFTFCLSKASHAQPVSPPAHIHIPVSRQTLLNDSLRHSEDTALFEVQKRNNFIIISVRRQSGKIKAKVIIDY